MPQLVRLYLWSVAIGFALSALFVVALLGANVMGLGKLVFGSSQGLIAGVMLLVFNGIVFSGVQFGLRVMLMAEPEDGSQGGPGLRVPALAPARVPAARRKI